VGIFIVKFCCMNKKIVLEDRESIELLETLDLRWLRNSVIWNVDDGYFATSSVPILLPWY